MCIRNTRWRQTPIFPRTTFFSSQVFHQFSFQDFNQIILSVYNLRLDWLKWDEALFPFHFRDYDPRNILFHAILFCPLQHVLECQRVWTAAFFSFAHISSTGALLLLCFQENATLCRRVETAEGRVRFPLGDSRSWWPRWNMKALCATAPSGKTSGARLSPRQFMMDTFPFSRSGCHGDDEWLPSASAARDGTWQPSGHVPARVSSGGFTTHFLPVLPAYSSFFNHSAPAPLS